VDKLAKTSRFTEYLCDEAAFCAVLIDVDKLSPTVMSGGWIVDKRQNIGDSVVDRIFAYPQYLMVGDKLSP
jgi:hypothetical protein